MKQKKVKASIIITTYNRVFLLKKRSLNSAMRQEYDDFEVIVVDDCSEDNTPQLMKSIVKERDDIRYLRLEKNEGISNARNSGVKISRGEYVVFLDDDNELKPNFLKVTVPLLDGLPQKVGAVSCGRTVDHGTFKEYHPPFSGNSCFYSSIDWGWLLRKEVFNKVCYDKRLRADEDADFGIRFFEHYNSYPVDRALEVAYAEKKKEGQKSVCFPTKKRLKSLDIFLEKNMPIFLDKGKKEDLSFIYRFAGRNYCCGKKVKKGKYYFKKAIKVDPSLRNFLNFLFSCFGSSVYNIYWQTEKKLAILVRCIFSAKKIS